MAKAMVVERRSYGLFACLVLKHLLVSKPTALLALICAVASAAMMLVSLEMGLRFLQSSPLILALFIVGSLLHELVHFAILDANVTIEADDYSIKLGVLEPVSSKRLYLAAIAGPLTPSLIGFIALNLYPEHLLILAPLLLQSINLVFDLSAIHKAV